MSWEVSLFIDTGLADEPGLVCDIQNVSNWAAPILDYVGISSRIRNMKMFCYEYVPKIETALEMFKDDGHMKEMAVLQDSHWDSVGFTRDFLEKLLEACNRHPKAWVEWS